MLEQTHDGWANSSFAEYLAYDPWITKAPGATLVKQPRGPISPKRQSNGLVLMTYYNDGGFGAFASHMAVNDRNNMWLIVGHENVDGTLHWTQPELALYDTQHSHGHGYPDLVSAKDGHVYLTETYKSTPGARAGVHQLDEKMLELLYTQHNTTALTVGGDTLAFTAAEKKGKFLKLETAKIFPDFGRYENKRDGMTLELFLKPPTMAFGCCETLFASHKVDAAGDQLSGLRLTQAANGSIMFEVRGGTEDSPVTSTWGTDPTCSAQLAAAGPHYLGMVLDVGPGMVMFFVDGKLCDGGIDQKTNKEWSAGWSLM